MTAIRQRDANKSRNWRLPVWGAFAFILIPPLVAMQFADDVRWDICDFAVGAAVLFCLGFAIELAFLVFQRARVRTLVIGMSLTVAMLVWAHLAVGVF
jgi:hypothetical protein